jgi:hypothetical protein
MAQEQRQQARDYFLASLKIYVDYEDTYSSDIVLRSLARVWQASSDQEVPAAISSILGATVEESETLLRERLEDESDEAGES